MIPRPPFAAPVRAAPLHRTAGWTAILFFALLAIYWLSPVRTPFDSRWSVHTAMSIARGHGGSLAAYAPVLAANADYAIDRSSGAPRSIYPVGVSLLAAPAALLVAALDAKFEARLRDRVPDKFEHGFASVIGATAAALFFRLLRGQFGSMASAAAGTLAFALGTTMWSDATRALWQHGPLVLCLVLAMLLLQRAGARPGLVPYAGLPLACAYLMRPTAAIPIVVLSAYVLLCHRAAFLRYLGWACLVGVPWLVFNVVTIGRILPPYYLVVSGDGPAPPSHPLDGLFGILASPGRGLLVYSPVFLLAPWGFVIALRERTDRALMTAYGVIAVVSIGLVAQWAIWWGGHAYGPRLLTDIVPFLALFAAFAVDRARRQASKLALSGCAALVLLSVAMQAPGALSFRTWLWNVQPDNIDTDTARLWDWRDPPFLRAVR